MANLTSTKSNLELKIHVISKIEERDKYCFTYIFTNEEVRSMTFPSKFRDVFKPNGFYLCRGVAIGDTVRVYDGSRVFQCGKFPINQEKIKSFLNPPSQTVDEILASPVKRNVSVKGILRKISDIIESPNSKRRELTIESLEGRNSVVCKLWGASADLHIPPPDTILTATCVQVSQWKGNVSLNSSVLTALQEANDENSFEGEIEAAEILENFSYIILQNKTLKITNDLLSKIFPNKQFVEGIHVVGKSKGTSITEIKIFNPTKKSKRD